jgi:hypothetical protein
MRFRQHLERWMWRLVVWAQMIPALGTLLREPYIDAREGSERSWQSIHPIWTHLRNTKGGWMGVTLDDSESL